MEANLNYWPVQIKLIPSNDPCLNNANLLIAADCTAYAFSDFHCVFMKKRVTVIGCPKLDGCDYSEKLSELFILNNIKSVTVVRMEVPCCKGIELAVKNAVKISGKLIPWKVLIITTKGDIVYD